MKQGRRQRRMIMSGELLCSMFRGRHFYEITRDAIPDDTKIRGAIYDPFTDQLTLLLENECFDEVPPREEVPILTPTGLNLLKPLHRGGDHGKKESQTQAARGPNVHGDGGSPSKDGAREQGQA